MKGLPDFKGNSQNFQSSEDRRARSRPEVQTWAPHQEEGAAGVCGRVEPPPLHPGPASPHHPAFPGVWGGTQGSARRHLPLTRTPKTTFHAESAQMILIKGHSHKGSHLRKTCERVYSHVLLKSMLQVSRWSLFCLGGEGQKTRGPLLAVMWALAL